MSKDDEHREYERSSSFARSFFQAGGGAEEGGNGNSGGDDGADGQPGDGGRRRRGRRLSRGNSDGQNSLAFTAAAAMVGEGEPTGNLPHMGDAADRQNSWYTDALAQGGVGEDLAAILGQVKSETQEEDLVADNDEVLEQYRIMAHVEASMRVQDNIGFDMAEYEKRRKLYPDSGEKNGSTTTRKSKPQLPEPCKVNSSSRAQMIPEEPPLLPPRANRKFVEQRTPRVSELCVGNIFRGTANNLPAGEHVVRCLGCRTSLRVNMLANLVNCPDCNTVSPASSTRR
jgi:hypothetical protein